MQLTEEHAMQPRPAPKPPPQDRQGDFADEHANPGFRAAIPINPAAAELSGPLEGFDPDHQGWGTGKPHEGAWHRFKRAARRAFGRRR
jgi:hypothetical protein